MFAKLRGKNSGENTSMIRGTHTILGFILKTGDFNVSNLPLYIYG